MQSLAPIVLFTYNRLLETELTINALRSNYLAPESDLFIFSDGPKNNSDNVNVEKVRSFLRTIKGFKSVTIFCRDINQGLANSIINGVTEIIEKFEKVIVLEDDLITSPNFLDFMNQSLDFYKYNDRVFSISGYTLNLPSLKKYNDDFYIGYRASSLGWASWKNRWKKVDWDVGDYVDFKKDIFQQIKFMRGGSDMPGMLKKQLNGKLDSWAIRWCYYQFKYDLITVFATKSKVNHIGDGKDATNAAGANKFFTILDKSNQRIFQFDFEPTINQILIKEFRQKFSMKTRLKEKIAKILKSI